MLVRSRFINFVTRWSIYFSTTRRDENFWSRHFRIFTFNIYINLLFNILITFRSFRIGISVWMFWIWNLDMGDTLSTYPWKKRFHYTLQQQHRSTWAKLKMRNQHYNAAHNHMCRTQWMTAKNMCRTKHPPLLCIDTTLEDKYITHNNVLHIYAVHKRRCRTGLQMNTRCSKNPTNTYLLRPCY